VPHHPTIIFLWGIGVRVRAYDPVASTPEEPDAPEQEREGKQAHRRRCDGTGLRQTRQDTAHSHSHSHSHSQAPTLAPTGGCLFGTLRLGGTQPRAGPPGRAWGRREAGYTQQK